MKRLVYGLIVLLAILHQDWWWWDDSETLVLGFVPIGLAYHAAILWALAVRYCWPAGVDDVEVEEAPAVNGQGGAA